MFFRHIVPFLFVVFASLHHFTSFALHKFDNQSHYFCLSIMSESEESSDEEDEEEFLSDDDWEAVLSSLMKSRPDLFLPKHDNGKKRKRRPRADLWASEWGRLLKHHNTMTPGTFEYVKFRLRFRVPYPLFKYRLIPAIKDANIFNKKRASYIPIEFKVMVALRIIGRDTDCDTASELSGIPKSTCNNIMKEFCLAFSKAFYDEFVYFPGGDELSKIMETFAKVGFPGAVGSMDVTHFRWLACPKEEFNLCKGKYPFPTLACQCIVDHNRRILFCSNLYDGRENDKNITADDEFTYDIMHGKFDDVEFKLYDKDGVLHICTGGYIIVDGGYQNLACFVDPLHDANGHKEVHWSEFLESVRKDVECTFAILKQRFRILRNGLQYSREVSNAIFKTCAILHNMLLAYDGLDQFQWNATTWDGEDPNMSDEDIYFHVPNDLNENAAVLSQGRFAVVVNDTTQRGPHFSTRNRNHHTLIREALVNHFYHQWRYGQLEWPRRFSKECKSAHPMKRIQRALADHTYDSLYVKATDLVLMVNGVARPDVDLGSGLFCSMLLPSTKNGIKLAEFKGVIITEAERRIREERGFGGYVIATQDGLLDCYEHAKNHTCKASMANSALRCFNRSENTSAVNNCQIKVKGRTVTLYTAANTIIPPNRELLYSYHASYKYPDVI
jgi:hypothetical protein